MKLLYITVEDEKEAENLASKLLEKGLIACGNIYSMKSIYRWNGNVEKEPETVLLAKTSSEKVEMAREEVAKLHSYDIPCILTIDANANEDFLNWIKEETSSKPK